MASHLHTENKENQNQLGSLEDYLRKKTNISSEIVSIPCILPPASPNIKICQLSKVVNRF